MAITIIAISALLVWLAWARFKKGENAIAMALLVLVAIILRCFVSTDPYLHEWDERFHALVAKNLLLHPMTPTLYDNPVLPFHYNDWINNHVWLHKPPLTMWGMSLSMKLFGVNEFAIRLPSIVLSSVGVLLMFGIGKRLFSRGVGFYAAFLFAINGWFLEMVAGRASTDHVDIYFTFFIQLGVYFAVLFSESKNGWWNILCGVAIGLAVLSKWLPALIVLPIWLLLVWNIRFTIREIISHGIVLVLVTLLVAAPWQIYIHYAFPLEAAWESSYNVRHFFEILEGHGHPFYYHFQIMRISYGELIYIPLIWFIYRSFKQRANQKYWALLVWVLVPFIFFSISATKMQSYTMFTAPALFLIAAVFADFLMKNRSAFRYNWLSTVVLVGLFALPIRYSLERIGPLEPIATKPVWQRNILAFANGEKNNKKAIVFNTPHAIDFMYFTDATAYTYLPAQYIQDSLKLKGYHLYLVDENERILPLEFSKDL